MQELKENIIKKKEKKVNIDTKEFYRVQYIDFVDYLFSKHAIFFLRFFFASGIHKYGFSFTINSQIGFNLLIIFFHCTLYQY